MATASAEKNANAKKPERSASKSGFRLSGKCFAYSPYATANAMRPAIGAMTAPTTRAMLMNDVCIDLTLRTTDGG